MEPLVESDDEPGLHVRTDPSPLARARALAAEMSARLCTTAKEADGLLDDLSTLPPLDTDGFARLVALAERLEAATRIVERTVDRAAEAVGERLPDIGTGVAVHPTAVRDRAAAVVAAREVAAAAEERLRVATAELGLARAQVAEPLPALAPEPTAAPVVAPPGRRRWFSRRRSRTEDDDTSESTSLLQQVAATTEEAFGARRAASARDDQLLLHRAQRDRAVEEVRVAERSWRDLAGDDPVEDVEAVVRRFDPQHQDALAVAQETAGVRAASTLLDRARVQWDEGWKALGFDGPAVEPGDVSGAQARATRPVVLVGAATTRAEAIARAAPAAPVVTVEASSG